MDAVQEAFYSLTAAALKSLSGVTACVLDGALNRLSKTAWTQLADVGDQSPYVSDIARGLRLTFPVAHKRLDEGLFRSFCDKFVRAFVVRYQASIYRAKRIGEVGAQQLLLDAQGIKELLLAAPVLRPASDKFMAGMTKSRAGGPAPDTADLDDDAPAGGAKGEGEDGEGGGGHRAPSGPPAVYVKFVQKEVPRVEMLLKIVSTPRDRFGDTIKALWTEASAADVTRVMDLKNMGKKEQSDVLVALGLAKPNFAGLGVPLSMGSAFGSGGGSGGTSMAAGLGFGGGSAPAPAPAPAASGTMASLGSGMNVGKLFGGMRGTKK
jgi:hypothetical protein